MAGAKVSWIYIYIYRYKRPKCTLHRYLGACNWRNRTHYVSSVTLPPFCTHASPPPFSLPRLSSFLLALFISLHPPLHLPSNVSSSSSFLLSFFFFLSFSCNLHSLLYIWFFARCMCTLVSLSTVRRCCFFEFSSILLLFLSFTEVLLEIRFVLVAFIIYCFIFIISTFFGA